MYMLAKESLETILRRPAILFCVHDDFFPLYSTMQVCVLMSKLNDDVLPGEESCIRLAWLKLFRGAVLSLTTRENRNWGMFKSCRE